MKNLQTLTSEELKTIDGGAAVPWFTPVGIVFGVLYSCYTLGYNYGKDAAQRQNSK